MSSVHQQQPQMQQQNSYPTPQQQQFYQLQQQQQMLQQQQAAGMNNNWNSGYNAAPMFDHQQNGGGNGGYQGNYGGSMPPHQYNPSTQGHLNGSLGEMPFSNNSGGGDHGTNQELMMMHQGNNMNPTAQPFISGGGPSASAFGQPQAMQREGSQDSTGSGTPTTPMTPGGTKRRNNPYAQVAVAEPGCNGQLPATVSPVGSSISPQPQFSGNNSPAQMGMMMNPNQQQQMMMGMNSNQQQGGAPWGSPASTSSFGHGVNFSPVAAPLPTSLPQREGNIRGHRSRGGGGGGGGGNPNYAGGPNQGGQRNSHQNSGDRGDNNGGGGAGPNPGQPATHADVMAQAGTYVELARTANGSSFIQAAVREGSDPENLQTIWSELSPCLSDLFLDAHGCYVIKSVMERLPPNQLNDAVAVMSNDPQLVFSMCTHSLHTRRVVQFLLDSMDCPFIFNLLTTHCAEIAMTQQGCIVMQRAMDTSTGQAKLDLYNAIYSNLLRFCTDPFANYVVQHMLEVGDKAANSAVFRHSFLAHVIQLSCNKFASNVMEKALFHLDEQLQHELLVGIYGAGEDVLYRMLQDSFGNYLIQSSIALAQYKDVFFISEKLRPVLQRTPYGHKIEGRLDRRLKGKAVGTRSPMIGATFKANQQPQQGGAGNGAPPQQQQGGGRGGNRGGSAGFNNRRPNTGSSADSFSGNSEDAVEEPW